MALGARCAIVIKNISAGAGRLTNPRRTHSSPQCWGVYKQSSLGSRGPRSSV
ncbi:hypothetical protein T06_9038 [Trichinella sp. T6]|nr:hypothetical protein T06_9038 [Trichinella sp. T6]